MAEIVSAAAVSHILMAPGGVEDRANAVVEGMASVGRQVRAANPDVIIVITTDHLFNLDLQQTEPFLVATGESFTPFGDMDIPTDPYPGHSDFARDLLAHLRSAALSVGEIEEIRPDHGTMVPMLFADPNRRIPIVPLYLNYALDAGPEARDAWAVGAAIADFISNSRPADERVAILATGGLSHWVGYDHPDINEAFDRDFLTDVETGHGQKWVNVTAAEIEASAGNGGLEIISWLLMLATVPNAKGETIFYEPMREWMTGMGGVVMRLPA